MTKTCVAIKKELFITLILLSFVIPYKLSHAMEVNKDNLYTTVKTLSEITPARNYRNLESLNEVARYIKNKFEEYGYVAHEGSGKSCHFYLLLLDHTVPLRGNIIEQLAL